MAKKRKGHLQGDDASRKGSDDATHDPSHGSGHSYQDLTASNMEFSGETGECESQSAKIVAESVRGEYRYAMLGVFVALACILAGIVLCLNGIGGSTSWTASLLGLESELNDAAPGVVLFVIGLFVLIVTRPKVKLKKFRG